MFIYEIGSLTYFDKNNEIEKALTWRQQLDNWARQHYVKTFNPAITFLREKGHNYTGRICVDQNEYFISKADIAVANLDRIDCSPGSIYELVRFKMQNKPVIAIGETHWSPHINSCISIYRKDIEETITLLETMFDMNGF